MHIVWQSDPPYLSYTWKLKQCSLSKTNKVICMPTPKIPHISSIERVTFWNNHFHRFFSIDAYQVPWNSMFIWEKIKVSNAMIFFSTFWMLAKSFYLSHCRHSLSSMPGELHVNIFKDVLNQSLESRGDDSVVILFDQPLTQVGPRFVLLYDSKYIHLHLASVMRWPRLLYHTVYVATIASAYFSFFGLRIIMLIYLRISLSVFLIPTNATMKYKQKESHKLASNDIKS